MANDNANMEQQQRLIDALQAQINTSQQNATHFFKAAADSTGKYAENLDKVGSLYQSIAEQASEILQTQKHIDEQIQKRKVLLGEIEAVEKRMKGMDGEAKKAEEAKLANLRQTFVEQSKNLRQSREQLDIEQKNLDTKKKQIDEIKNQQSAMGKLFSTGILKLAATAFSVDRLVAGLRGMSQAARDVADISIQSGSFIGMTGDYGHDLMTISAATASYGVEISKAQVQLGLLGYTTEEVNSAFKDFAKISPFEGQAEHLKDLTIAVGALSKELNVSLGDASQYVIESQQKFGRTASQTAMTLYQVKEATRQVNQAVGQTVIVGRDVTKVLFDMSRETDSVTQNQDLLAQMLTKNLVGLQAQGANYQSALKGATSYIEALTTKAPQWTRIMAGDKLLSEIRDTNSGVLQEIQKSQPTLYKSIQQVMAGEGQYAKMGELQKKLLVQKMLEGTGAGVEVMQEQMHKLIEQAGSNASTVIQSIYGITDPVIQQQYIQQDKANHEAVQSKERFLELSKQIGSTDKKVADAARQELVSKFHFEKNSVDQMTAYYLEHQDKLKKNIIKDQQDKDAADKKALDDKAKQEKENRVKELTDKIAEEKKAGHATGYLEEEKKSLTEEGLKEAGGKALEEQEGAGTLANPAQAVINFLKSPLGSLVSALTSATGLVANSIIQTGLLTEIATKGGLSGGAVDLLKKKLLGGGGEAAEAAEAAEGAEAAGAAGAGEATVGTAGAVAGGGALTAGAVVAGVAALGYEGHMISQSQEAEKQGGLESKDRSLEMLKRKKSQYEASGDTERAKRAQDIIDKTEMEKSEIEKQQVHNFAYNAIAGLGAGVVSLLRDMIPNTPASAPSTPPPPTPNVPGAVGASPVSNPASSSGGGAKVQTYQTAQGSVSEITIPATTIKIDHGAAMAQANNVAAPRSQY